MSTLDIHIRIDESDLHTEYPFDAQNPNFNKASREHNHFFVHSVQSHMNDILRFRGHVFLNDVFDAMGYPRTALGALVGWALDFGHTSFIEFKIVDHQDVGDSMSLIFNPQGIIFDKIESSHAMSIAHYNIQRNR